MKTRAQKRFATDWLLVSSCCSSPIGVLFLPRKKNKVTNNLSVISHNSHFLILAFVALFKTCFPTFSFQGYLNSFSVFFLPLLLRLGTALIAGVTYRMNSAILFPLGRVHPPSIILQNCIISAFKLFIVSDFQCASGYIGLFISCLYWEDHNNFCNTQYHKS